MTPSVSSPSTTRRVTAALPLSRPNWRRSSAPSSWSSKSQSNPGGTCSGQQVCVVDCSSPLFSVCSRSGPATRSFRKHPPVASALYVSTAFADPCNRYYLSDLLNMVGITDGVIKSKINIGIACWGLICGTALALTAPRFKRRPMYLTCASALLCVYIAWTISMERFLATKAQSAAIATIFFIFAYSPAYNLGYNALTYSACPFRFITCVCTNMNKRISLNCSLTWAAHAVSPGSSSTAAAQTSLPPT